MDLSPWLPSGSRSATAGGRTVPVRATFCPETSLSRQSLPAAAEAQSLRPPGFFGFLRVSVPPWLNSGKTRRTFLHDVVAVRRGDHRATRLQLASERLADKHRETKGEL